MVIWAIILSIGKLVQVACATSRTCTAAGGVKATRNSMGLMWNVFPRRLWDILLNGWWQLFLRKFKVQRCGKFVASGTVIYASGTSMAGAEFANLMNSFYPLLRCPSSLVQEILKFCPIGRRWDGGYAMQKAPESRHGRAITAKKMVGKLCLLCDERCNCNCVNIDIITTTVRVITLPSCCDHVAITLPRRYKTVNLNIMQLFSS